MASEVSREGSDSNEGDLHLQQLMYQTAAATHDGQRAHAGQILDQAWQAAQGVLKAAFVLNGGALVAVLALVGSALQGNRALPPNETIGVLSWFAVGLAAATLAGLIAYAALLALWEAATQRRFSFEVPFVLESPRSRRADRLFFWLRAVAVLLIVLSVGCALGGSFVFTHFAIAALNVRNGGSQLQALPI